MLRYGHDRRDPALGFSLVEILVVVAVIVVLSAITMSVYMGHGGVGAPPGKAHSPVERAKDTVCSSNLRQVRAAISMEQMNEENNKFPASLKELKGLPKDFLLCPEGKEPFQYNPETGEVHCVHPGHEKY
jgi:prepilin-type N-terminal cleavage/methylation domain-containing protein